MNYLNGTKEKEAIYWMKKAVQAAKKSSCPEAKCGCVIIKNKKIIGKGYNASPLNKKENPGYMHAEWKAIIEALKTNPKKIYGSKLYFTRVDKKGGIIKSGKPYCTICSRWVLDIGIKIFVLWHYNGICEYPTDKYNKLSYKYSVEKIPENLKQFELNTKK